MINWFFSRWNWYAKPGVESNAPKEINDAILTAINVKLVEEVLYCPLLEKVIVLVDADNYFDAIGMGGRCVELASAISGMRVQVLTAEDLEKMIEYALDAFEELPFVDDDISNRLVGEGFLTYRELSYIDKQDLMLLSSFTRLQTNELLATVKRFAEFDED